MEKAVVKGRLIWIADEQPQGWACSQCKWSFSMPTLLTDNEAKNAYDRLASASFRKHDCTKYAHRVSPLKRDSFAQQARKLVIQGFKPKDAVQIALQEIMFEHRGDPALIEKARVDAEDFLRRVKEGVI
jgi:hypothetical protein